MTVEQTYSPSANVSGRSPVDFAAHVKTEEVNAVTSGLVKGAEASRLKAEEVDMASSALKSGKPAARRALGHPATKLIAGAAHRGARLSEACYDGEKAEDCAKADAAESTMKLAHNRAVAVKEAKAARVSGEAAASPETAATATAGSSTRSSILDSTKAARAAAQASSAEASLGSTAVAEAIDKKHPVQTFGRSTIKSTIGSPLKDGKAVAKGSAEALAKTKTALISANAANPGAAMAAKQTVAARAIASIKETIRGIVAVAASGAAPVVLMFLAFILLIAILTSLLSGMAMMGKPGGEAMAQVAIEQYEKWNSSDAGTQNEMRSAYLAAGGQGGGAPWCSCFVTWCWKTCGFDQILGMPSNPAWAASWLPLCSDPAVGTVIAYNSSYRPQPGDIIVDGAKDASWSNHVGLVVSGLNENGTFRVIHGNWGDAVGQAYYFPGQTGGQGEGFTYVARPNYPNIDGGGTALGEGVDFSMSETAFVNEWAPRINSWFDSWDPNAPLAGYGEEFARAAYRNRYDPRLSPAMSRMESGGGRYCFRPHNAWGWGSASWSSWSEAIEAHVSGLTNGYSNMTITEIVNKYCPDGNEAAYIANLEQWLSEM